LNESDPEDPVVTRVVEDWVVLSDKEASIDAALAGDGARSLGDDESFTAGLEELPEDALSRVYVDVATAVERFAPQLGLDDREALETFGLDKIDFAGAWARAEDDGAQLAAIAEGSQLDTLAGAKPFTSKLLERVPQDAFAFVAFRGEAATDQLNELKDNPLYQMGAPEIERFLGVTVDELVRIFEGEIAFYVRRGAPLPEFTLLLDAANPETARASVDRVLRSVAQRLGGEVNEEGGVTTGRFGGLTVYVADAEGLIVLTTSRGGVSDVRDTGEKLPDNQTFKDALEAADAPDTYTGLAWIDLAEAMELILGLADTAEEDIPPEIRRNLDPLRSFLAYGTADADSAEVRAFLGID
jgi:hypothetical protein